MWASVSNDTVALTTRRRKKSTVVIVVFLPRTFSLVALFRQYAASEIHLVFC